MLSRLDALTGSVSALTLLLAVAVAPAAAQTERRIDCGVAVTNDAVVVARATVGDTDVPCLASPRGGRGPHERAAPFRAGDTWLQNATVYLFNRTNKAIAWAWIDIGFPQTGDGASTATAQRSYQIILGHRPEVTNFDPRTGRPMTPLDGPPLSFGGGRTLVIHLSDYADQIQERIRDVLFTPLTSIRIGIVSIVFADGMLWNPGGNFQVPDREHPGRWERMPDGYFPGNVHANWPPTKIETNRK